MTSDDIARRHAGLAVIDAELARLRGQYDLLMNAFRFEAAKALTAPIAAAERERAALAAALPPLPVVSEPAAYTVASRRRRRH